MTISEKIQAILVAATGVTDLCPASRIRVPGRWQNLDRPYVVHFPVTARPTHTHDGLEGLMVWPVYQVSVYADTYEDGMELSDAIRDALDGAHTANGGLRANFGGYRHIGEEEPEKLSHFPNEFYVAETTG